MPQVLRSLQERLALTEEDQVLKAVFASRALALRGLSFFVIAIFVERLARSVVG